MKITLNNKTYCSACEFRLGLVTLDETYGENICTDCGIVDLLKQL